MLRLLAVIGAVALATTSAAAGRVVLYERTDAPAGWRVLDAAEPHVSLRRGGAPLTPSTVSIGLNGVDWRRVQALYDAKTDIDSDDYAEWLSADELRALVTPAPGVVAPVLAWLRAHGAAYVHNGDVVQIERASVALLEALFGCEMRLFEHVETRARTLRALGAVSVPAEVFSSIAIVADLVDFPAPRRTRAEPLAELHTSSIYRYSATPFLKTGVNIPAVIKNAYNVPSDLLCTSGNTSSVIYAFNEYGGASQEDLTDFDNQNGVVPPQSFNVIGENLPVSLAEASLDVQMMTSMALNCNVSFMILDTWMYGFATSLLAFGDGAPLVASVSYTNTETDACQMTYYQASNGGCPSGWNAQTYVTNTDRQFQKLGLTGRTVFVSSGDLGAPGYGNPYCLPAPQPELSPCYPATSAIATSVGATVWHERKNAAAAAATNAGETTGTASAPICHELACTSPPFASQVPAHYATAGFTSGCGFSNYVSTPTWQTSSVASYLSSSAWRNGTFSSQGRGYPDLSLIGVGAAVVNAGTVMQVGGTSMSTPLIAGLFSLLNDALFNAGGQPIGPLNALLYQMAAEDPSTFTGVTEGSCRCTESCCSLWGFGAQENGAWAPSGAGLGTPNWSSIRDYVLSKLQARQARKAAAAQA